MTKSDVRASEAPAAIVLGAAVLPGGGPSPTLALRVSHAVRLWRDGKVDRIVLTGGAGRFGPAEAVVAGELARSLGVPASALLLETDSTTTFENIVNARRLLAPRAPVVLVSNRWHLPRAWLIARLLGQNARVSGPRGQATAARTMAAILREIAAMPLAVFRAVRWGRRSGR